MRKIASLAFCTIALLCFAGSAQAQIDCDDCDPYSSWCSEPCGRCLRYGQDGCLESEMSTCGETTLNNNCIRDGCSPSFQTTDRTTVGTYGETLYGWIWRNGRWYPQWSCEHHTVDRVTQTDVNQCNLNSYWWTRQYCHDYVDYQAPWNTTTIPDCCAYPRYCNDWHSCF